MYPDLIIHKRDSKENLVAIELKHSNIQTGCDKDDTKLMYLTCEEGEYKLHTN
jgi:hypothetical protein